MREQFYLFVFEDDSTYEMTCGVSLKDAVWETAKYNGISSELLQKSLRGFENGDVNGVIDLYNLFVHSPNDRIAKIYIVERVLYDEYERYRKENGDK